MIDALTVALIILASWAFGRCTLHLITRSGDSGDLAELSTAIGFTVLTILVNLCYLVLHLGMALTRGLLLALLAAACCFLAWTWRRSGPGFSPLFGSLLLFGILALPAFIGGEQYYVFRGNWWDHFTYITAAFGFANHPVSDIAAFDTRTFLSNELLAFAPEHYGARPSVMLLFSLFLVGGKGDLFLRAFLYTSALLAMAYPPLHLLCRQIRTVAAPDAPPSLLPRIVPAAFLLGFWGQYIFDINAWGQLGALSLLMGFLAAFAQLLNTWRTGDRLAGPPPLAPYLGSILLFAGAWLVYPESGLVHLLMIVVVTLAWIVLTRCRIAGRSGAWLTLLPLFSALFLLPTYQATIGHVVNQARFGSGTANDWWLFHDAYIVGIDPPMTELAKRVGSLRLDSIGSTLADPLFRQVAGDYWHVPFNGILAFFGLYFLTPSGTADALRIPWIFAAILAALLFSASFLRNLLSGFRHAGFTLFLARALSLAGLALCIHFLVGGKWWSAGKLLSYTSPYIFLVMTAPLLIPGTLPGSRLPERIVRGVAVFLVVASLGFGVARVWCSSDRYGIGFYRNYPSIQGPNNKVSLAWDLDVSPARACAGVNVDGLARNPFYSHYAKLKLAYAGIPFYTSLPIVEYFGKGDTLGFMPPMRTDCDMILQSTGDYRVHAVITRRGQ